MTTFTEIRGLAKQQTAENPLVWGNVWNTQVFDLLDEAVAGSIDIDMSSGDVTLTDDDGVSNQARNMMLVLTGAAVLPATVFIPQRNKLYVIDNQTGETMTVKTTSGVGIDVIDGEIVVAVVDKDTNQIYKMVLQSSGLVAVAPDPGTTFTADAFQRIPPGTDIAIGTSRSFRTVIQGMYITYIHEHSFNFVANNPEPVNVNFQIPSGTWTRSGSLIIPSHPMYLFASAGNDIRVAVQVFSSALFLVQYPDAFATNFVPSVTYTVPGFSITYVQKPI